MATSEDFGEYYRIRMDTRDLNYEKYFSEGDKNEIRFNDYHSHNTSRLTVKQVEEVLLTLPEVRSELAAWEQGRS